MSYLLASLRGREKERAQAFMAIGLVAVAVQEDIKPFLPKIMEIFRMSLPIPKDIASKKRGPTGNKEEEIPFVRPILFHFLNLNSKTWATLN